ncbi:hypothetical protein F2P56_011241 [Juglans regia]|uniref:Uncharacterized protein n=1 Tax=Juglans regia TaxID=51240 RepID=A0A834CZH5_JUGRE|nr:hypothetical protein F2P56_011241 [Juglans regia]
MEEFNGFIDAAGLTNLRFEGNQFLWCNGQEGRAWSWAQLDRCLISSDFITRFPAGYMKYLPRTTSDHAPVLISLELEFLSYGFSAFKFQQMWMIHESFMDCVAKAWEDRINDYEDQVTRLEENLQDEYNEEDEQDYLVAKAELDVWRDREEMCLRQQAKQSWLNKGEASAQFF